MLDPGAGTGKLTEQLRSADDTWRQVIEADRRYAPLQVAHFAHHQIADQGLLSERVASISFVAALSDVERAHLLTRPDRERGGCRPATSARTADVGSGGFQELQPVAEGIV